MSESRNDRYLRAKRALFDKRYDFLNPQQREAVFCVNGPLLVLAGAGTGKTTLLVNRIAYILKYGNAYNSEFVPAGVTDADIEALEASSEDSAETLDMLLPSFTVSPAAPWSVLSITFTNKAAGEIKSRLLSAVGEDSKDIWAGTFHSICLRILRMHADKLGYNRDFTIYDEDDSKKLIDACMKQLNIDEKIIPRKVIQNTISRAKDELCSPYDFDNSISGESNILKLQQLQQISSAYALYQRKLKECMAMDFDDIIMQTVVLLRDNPDVLGHFAVKFKYILVDEYQDTNHSQFMLVKLLSSRNNNIMVVGDDDQSIYKFRGATIENILRFDEEFPDARVIKLEQNYRSYGNILKAASSVIRNNFGRRGKELWTERGDGEKITVKCLDNQNEEARFIINKIMELIIREKRKYSDFAVLYRTNAQSSTIESVFAKSGIPYRVMGGTRFFDRKETKDILSYLCVVNNPGDNLRLRRIINEPKRKIGDATIAAIETIAENVGKTMFEVMENASQYPAISKSAYKFKGFVELIKNLQEVAVNEPLSELFRKTIELSGYREMLLAAEENGEASSRRENVDEMISTAIEYETANENATLSGYLEEIALISDIDNYDTDADAVVLMTIHSAKGLEFPVVFLPGMEEGLFPSMQALLSPDQLEEERRLAYVALTRAKDRVFSIHVRERLLWGKTQYNPITRFLSEIPEEYKVCEGYKTKPKFRTEFGEKTRVIKISNELIKNSDISSSVGKTKSYDTFSTGDRVAHLTFGQGTILSAREMGADVLYEIAFDNVGTKKIMATYAKLKKI